MKKLAKIIDEKLMALFNRMSLVKKFMVLYATCLIIPLFVTDAIILKSVYENGKKNYEYDVEYVTGLYKNYLTNVLEGNIKIANSVDMNDRINDFLSVNYETPYQYYAAYQEMIKGSLVETFSGVNSDRVTIYSDTEGILEGAIFRKLSSVKEMGWYKEFVDGDEKPRLTAFYDEGVIVQGTQKRRFYYVRKLNFHKRGCDKVIVIDNDCSAMMHDMKALGDKYPMYISCGEHLIFNNIDDSAVTVYDLNHAYRHKHSTAFTLQGLKMQIVIMDNDQMLTVALSENKGIIICMIVLTILLPVVVVQLIRKSIITRIQKLEKAFGDSEGANDAFVAIDNIDGSDEIAGLMHKYNEMVGITNSLIQTVYKDKLKEQENDLARKNAELLALQSQINPHFLFNALESIRMHSLLKGEEETSVMVGKLALMQRQNVEWGSDFVTIKKEMESIEAYLYLQGYRFGERLSFEIDVDDDCGDYLVPKLTIVTFVENACVHGVEAKSTPGWIFVRVSKDEANLIIEVEDTGGGMEDEEVTAMLNNISNVSIEAIKGKKHVGVLNASLRLKMITENRVSFAIDSEPGIGMTIEIKIPLDTLKRI